MGIEKSIFAYEIIRRCIILMFLGFSFSQNTFANEYKPGCLLDSSGKPLYASDSIDWNFYYSYWMPTMLSNYGSAALVRESIVPSAMVDSKGDLFTISFYMFDSQGPRFRIAKYEASSYIKYNILWFSPWEEIYPLNNIKSEPYLDGFGDDKNHFKNYIHNAFQPCVAQDVSDNCDLIAIAYYIPPGRYSYSDDREGIRYEVRRKSDLSITFSSFYQGEQKNNQFSFHHLRPRRYSDSYGYNAEFGNFQGASIKAGSTVYTQMYFISSPVSNDFNAMRIYNLKTCCLDDDYNSSGMSICPRFIKHGDVCYGMCCFNGNYNPRLFYHYVNNGHKPYQKFTLKNDYFASFGNITHGDTYNYYTPYNYDFCILPDDNIVCVLGLRNISDIPGDSWNSTYINWSTSSICLVLSSCSLSEQSSNLKQQVSQNVIYSTGRSEGCPLACGFSQYLSDQLHRNTHKICTYTSPTTSNKYIIYCYCYPGKKKQLYLGYAPYFVSNNKVHLLTKVEFKNSNGWGDSFGNFTKCNRIISMDCKNGHIWITWVGPDDSLGGDDARYYYFHIKAKDLVGE